MKLTKERLKTIIKEELQHVMLEEGVMDKLRDMGRKTGKWISREWAGETKKIVGAVNDSLKELFTDEELASLRQTWEGEGQKKYGGGKAFDDIIKEYIPEYIEIGRSGEARNIAETVRSILSVLVEFIVDHDLRRSLKPKIEKYGRGMKNYTNAAIDHVGKQDMETGTYRERKPRK
jgi:uncharacterized protein YukE